MTDQDRRVIVTYLKKPTPSRNDACIACHLENGVGRSHLFHPRGKNAVTCSS